MTSEFLGLAATRVGNEERLIVLDQQFLELALGRLVLVLLAVSNDGFGDCLADGHDLGAGTTATDAHADVQALKTGLAQEKDGLHNLHPHRDWLNNVD